MKELGSQALCSDAGFPQGRCPGTLAEATGPSLILTWRSQGHFLCSFHLKSVQTQLEWWFTTLSEAFLV